MRVMFASDIHGSVYYCRKMPEAYEKEGAGRLVLLGELLYRGPRDELPLEYAPKEENVPTYGVLDNGIFTIRGLGGETVKEITL